MILLQISTSKRKRPIDTPKRIIERRERKGEREREGERERQKERYREGGRDKRERERERGERDREVKGIETERESKREIKILVKSSKPRNKAQTKIDYKNYDVQL